MLFSKIRFILGAAVIWKPQPSGLRSGLEFLRPMCQQVKLSGKVNHKSRVVMAFFLCSMDSSTVGLLHTQCKREHHYAYVV